MAMRAANVLRAQSEPFEMEAPFIFMLLLRRRADVARSGRWPDSIRPPYSAYVQAKRKRFARADKEMSNQARPGTHIPEMGPRRAPSKRSGLTARVSQASCLPASGPASSRRLSF